MHATNIGKTILVWDKLKDDEVIRLIKALKHLILNYRNCTEGIGYEKPIPVYLYNKGIFLAIIKKHNEIIISTSKKNGEWIFNPILNGDELYESIKLIEKYDSKQFLQIYDYFPNTTWINLPYNQAFETYALSPNINPENFIKHLEEHTLSDFYKDFLKEVGLSLTECSYQKEVENTILDVNNLFAEER